MIGFEQPTYSFIEDGRVSVVLTKNDTLSEQHFATAILVASPPENVSRAILDEDYQLGILGQNFQLQTLAPNQQRINVSFIVLRDAIVEGVEAFALSVSPNDGNRGFSLGTYPITTIFIDDDGEVYTCSSCVVKHQVLLYILYTCTHSDCGRVSEHVLNGFRSSGEF